MAVPQTFDAVKYKETTRQQWENVARAWHRWSPMIEAWLGPATEEMLDMAELRPGSRVLDLAAGAGGQTQAAARRVGPQGYVLATDIAPTLLDYALQDAHAAGLNNVETRVSDAEELDVEPESFDLVQSRVGLIYFRDQQKVLDNSARALKRGGKVAAIVYSTAENNRFFSIPVSIIRQHAQLPPPLSGQPGPFSLGSPGVLEQAYKRAGFRDIDIRIVPAPLRMPSAAECLLFERESFGALHQMLSGIGSAAQREAVWGDIQSALQAFDTPDGFVGPCELVIGIGVK